LGGVSEASRGAGGARPGGGGAGRVQSDGRRDVGRSTGWDGSGDDIAGERRVAGAELPRLIFFDLDGTLLAPGSVLTERTRGALRATLDRGVTLALATGGFSHRALQLAREIDEGRGATWTMTHNGGAVWDPGGSLVSHTPMPVGAMRAVLRTAGARVWCVYEALRGKGGTVVYYAGRHRHNLDHFVWGPRPAESAPDARKALAPGVERRRREPSDEELSGVLGCWLIGTPKALRELDGRVEEGALLGARYLHWSQRLAQILNQPRLQLVGRDVGALGISKGAAAERLCARLGVDAKEAAAFGDADNDVEMLELVGTAVAMRNATARVQAVADEVAPPNTEDGVAQTLERWLDLRDS
jgi:hydroxymethylpyrimidine pyrophosphatase-like HAD family hydrolase